MKKKNIGLGATGLALGVMIALPSLSLAYRGDPAIQGPNCTPERHEAMTKAFGNNDYEAWANLMDGRGRVTQLVNKDNFSKFAEAHKLMLEGRVAEAREIRQDLGLGVRHGSGGGWMMGQ